MPIGLLCQTCWKTTSNLKAKTCKCGLKFPSERKYRVRIKTSSGWKSGTTDSLSEARLLESELKKQSKGKPKPKGVPTEQPENQVPTLSDIWPLYLSWAKVYKKSWDMDYSRYNNHLKEPLSHFPMDSVKPFHVQNILNMMHNKDYKPATVKQVLMLIKRVYSWSTEQDLYTGPNPCGRIKPPKFDNRVTASLSRDELQKLVGVLDGWPNERVVLPIKFALYSGKRKHEILNLKWKDVDIDNGFMTIQDTKNGSKQSLPVNGHCLELLRRSHQIRIGSYVFPSRKGHGYMGGGFDRTWRKIRNRAGLQGFRFHDLRHTYASYLASSGKVDIYTLKELLGHSDIKMTQRYAHLINGALRKAANVADEVF